MKESNEGKEMKTIPKPPKQFKALNQAHLTDEELAGKQDETACTVCGKPVKTDDANWQVKGYEGEAVCPVCENPSFR